MTPVLTVGGSHFSVRTADLIRPRPGPPPTATWRRTRGAGASAERSIAATGGLPMTHSTRLNDYGPRVQVGRRPEIE